MLAVQNSRSSLKVMAEIFSPSIFREIIHGGKNDAIIKKIKRYTLANNQSDVSEAIKLLYSALLASYRTEYFYKNALLTEQLLKKYNLSTTIVLNEFKIGNSKADFVLLNGESRVYEIKSDLDSLQKLPKQIADYKKFSDKIYIVTCEKFIEKIMEEYENSSIGIILFNEQNELKEFKSAKSDSSQLEHEIIFKTLRKNEYLDIIKNYFGFIPDAPNTKIFSVCKELVSEIDIKEFQKLAVEKLKKRRLQCVDLLKSNSTPNELKYLCYINDLSEMEYLRLFKFLNRKC